MNVGVRSPVARILPAMKRTERRPVKKRVVRSWKQARVMFERWRVNLTYVQVELKLPGLPVSRPLTLLEEGRWKKRQPYGQI